MTTENEFRAMLPQTPHVLKPGDGEGAGTLRIIAPTETYSVNTPLKQ